MQKGAKSILPIDKENTHILQRKTNMVNHKSGLRFPFILHQLWAGKRNGHQ